MTVYGLIGKHLSHSFSKQYFEDKFEKENIYNNSYSLFELKSISEFPGLVERFGPELRGLNVTIPYKKSIINYLDELDPVAEKIGAVNVIKKEGTTLKGYNSDYFGFKKSLKNWIDQGVSKALVLGTGGASDAVAAVLHDMNIEFVFVSRKKGEGLLTYDDLDQSLLVEHFLIVNTTPLGMFPDIESKPEVPYQYLSKQHYLFDLVYNPKETAFLKEGKTHGVKIKNGLEMLEQQAEEAWRIWNQ